jgi:uncharacterized membrane protein YbhN (UPF0104 family)
VSDAERSPGRGRPRWRKRLVTALKLVILVAVVAGLGLAIERAADQWRAETNKLRARIEVLGERIEAATDEQRRAELVAARARLRAQLPTLRNLRWQNVGVACVFYAIGLLPSGMLLHRAAESLGQPCRVPVAIASQLLGHAGKYVPGKAMVVVLRVGGLARDGVKPVPAAVSVFLETFLMMAVGGAVAGIVICWLPVPTWMILAAIAMAVAASLPTLPFVLRLVAARIGRRSPSMTDAEESETGERGGLREGRVVAGWPLFLAGWGWSLLSWLLIGAAFTCLLLAIPNQRSLPNPAQLYATGLAAIALAMVVGFASLLPGGAGVRELVLTTILFPAVGTAHALLAAIAARLMFVAVESFLAGGAWLWLRTIAPPPAPPGPG